MLGVDSQNYYEKIRADPEILGLYASNVECPLENNDWLR